MTVIEMYKIAFRGLNEERKFFSYMEEHDWSAEMQNLREITLWCPVLDQELIKNEGSDNPLFHSSWRSFRAIIQKVWMTHEKGTSLRDHPTY